MSGRAWRPGTAVAVRWTGWLIRLFPGGFRSRYGREMLTTFEEHWEEERGRLGRSRSLLRTTVNLTWAALREHLESRRGTRVGAVAGRTGTGKGALRRGGSMRYAGDDIRYGLRLLRRNPGFAAVVLITLGLGIGMNTAVFSVLYGALYAPLPYEDAASIVRVGRTHPSMAGALLPISPARYEDLRDEVSSLTTLEVESSASFVLSEGDAAVRVRGGTVSSGFFDLLGVAPAQGRAFTPDDDVAGAPAVVVVSDAFWRTRLGGEAAAVGRTIRLDDEPYTVIGIMPPDFAWRDGAVWVPLRLTEQQRSSTGNYLGMMGRLKPGADVARASAELGSLWAPLRDAYPQGNEDTGMAAETLREASSRSVRASLYILAGAAAFVLLIACVNVANLLLVRVERRQREVGVRAALGARRGRLVTQLLTEGLLIAILGGVVGTLVAWVGVRALIGAFGNAIPQASRIHINAPVLAFSLFASLVTGMLLGALPALRGAADFSVLREGSRGGTARTTLLGRSLVVLEVALAIILVTGAGLLLKSYARVLDSNLGFDAHGLVATDFWFPASQYQQNAQAVAFLERTAQSLAANSAIQGVAMANMVPIREYGSNYTEVGVEGRDATARFVEIRYVTPSFFETLGIDLVQGRDFTDEEARAGAPVRVITRTLARQLFGEESPLGWRLSVTNTPPEIIGVVDDVRDFGPDRAPRPIMYAPTRVASNLLVRSPRPAAAVADLVRAAARDADPNVVPIRIESMDEILDRAVDGRRFQLTLIGVFAVTALLLACVGIYGVLSYSVERQTREIGVRIALGARAAGVAAGIAWHGGRLALLGTGVGVVGAYAMRQAIAAQLFDVESADPAVYAAVGGLLLAVALIACLVPAHRASAVDPLRALNQD